MNSKISSWLYAIARNETINKLSRGASKEEQFCEYELENIVQKENLQDEAFVKAQEAESFNQAFCKLKEEQKLILSLRYYQEKSYLEIAQILNIPLNTVKVKLLRAKKTLQKNLS